MNATSPKVASSDTDLFPAAPKVAIITGPAPVAAAVANQLRTDELQVAVALSVGGNGEPSLEVIGKTKNQEPKVTFVFDLPAGVSARELEDQFYRKKFVCDVNTVFEKMRSLKKRIANEGKYSA